MSVFILICSFVLADLGIAHHPRPDHAAYVASWLRLLEDDPRAIFTAASKAQLTRDQCHRSAMSVRLDFSGKT
jgi:antirestriction protein ArdC